MSLIRSCAKHDMHESKRGALTINASMEDKAEDENWRQNGKRNGRRNEKRRARRLRVARVSASHDCGCWVLMNPEPARRCFTRTPGLATKVEVPNEAHNPMKRIIVYEEPSDPGAFISWRIQTLRDRANWAQNEHCRWKDSLQSSNFVPHSCDDLANDGEVIGGHRGDSVIAP
jgi:hypothetical protein